MIDASTPVTPCGETGSDEEKNRLCRPIRYWDQSADYVTAYMALMASERARGASNA